MCDSRRSGSGASQAREAGVGRGSGSTGKLDRIVKVVEYRRMMPAIVPNQIFMARKSKWIESDSLHEPASAVAQRAIRARLETVWQWLPMAAEGPVEDVENLHQLRVSTRRAAAALELFEPMLPRSAADGFANN